MFDRRHFFTELLSRCTTDEFRGQLGKAAVVEGPEQAATLGNGVEALFSVPTALACFALGSNDYVATVGNAILLGGDTDTIGAMAGALCGAHLGRRAIPERLVQKLEDGQKGKTEIVRLATGLCERWEDTA
jgi:poly(ADP-ribose) glycohydrolase ARH3